MSHDERMEAPQSDARECANSGLSDRNFGVLDSRLINANLEDKMELIRMYRRGLKPAIRNQIEDLPCDYRPDTIARWMEKATELDNDWCADEPRIENTEIAIRKSGICALFRV